MRGAVKGLLIAATAVLLVAPPAIASAGLTTQADDPHANIVGGVDATEPYPFTAGLNVRRGNGGWGCGAVVIRPTWILTAHHCATDAGRPVPPDAFTFRIGSLKRNSGGTIARGKRVIPYPGGNPDTALIELTAPVPVKPINIARSAPVGTPIRILGWGCTKDPGCAGAENLQQLDTTIVPDSRCRTGRDYLCIDNPEGKRGACYGDSGGPGVIKVDGQWVLAGNTSGGTSSVCAKGPSIYTELPNYRSWIESYAGPDAGGTRASGRQGLRNDNVGSSSTGPRASSQIWPSKHSAERLAGPFVARIVARTTAL
jgi:secreted trypsin-like serine protease